MHRKGPGGNDQTMDRFLVGGLGEVDKRKKVFLLSIYWVVLGCFKEENIPTSYKSGEQKRDNKICGCQGL